MDIYDVKTQHFKEMLYKPIILVMEIHELWWPNLDMVVHEISLPKCLDYTGPLMKRCILMTWRSMVVHEWPLVAMEFHGRFHLGGFTSPPGCHIHTRLLWVNPCLYLQVAEQAMKSRARYFSHVYKFSGIFVWLITSWLCIWIIKFHNYSYPDYLRDYFPGFEWSPDFQ